MERSSEEYMIADSIFLLANWINEWMW